MIPHLSSTTIQNGKTYQLDCAAYLNMLKKRKWLIVLPSLIILPLVTLKLLLQKPVYESTASILIEPENPNIVGFQEIFKNGSYSDYYQTQYRLISSRSMIEKTIDKLSASEDHVTFEQSSEKFQSFKSLLESIKSKLNNSVFNRMPFIQEYVLKTDTISIANQEKITQEKRIENFRKALTVKPVIETRLVDIIIKDLNANEATRKVNTLAEIYVSQNLLHKNKTMEESSQWLTGIVEDLKYSLQESEQKLQYFVQEYGMASVELEDMQSVVLEGLRNLNAEYINTKIRRFDLQTRLNELTNLQSQPLGQSASLATTSSEPLLATLFMKHADLNGQRAKIAQHLKSSHPRYLDVHAQIEQIETDIMATIRRQMQSLQTELRAVVAKESALRQELSRHESSGLGVNTEVVKYSLLKGDTENKRVLYQDIVRRLSEANITKGFKANNIRMIQSGTVPVKPLPAWKALKWGASAMLTFSIGMALAFLAERLDKRFRDIEEAERYLQLPSLGFIPRSTSHQWLLGETTDHRHDDDGLNPYRLLRTNVQMMMAQRAISSLLVTSAAPGEGKSTTVANLGFVFSILNKKVLLVDADLYRPTLHNIFKLPMGLGLSDFLMQGDPYQNFIQQTDIPNLSLLTRGSTPTQPTELLSSYRMKELIQQLATEYDVVIYDSPMVLSLPDTTILASEIEGTLLIHDINLINRDAISTAKCILEKSNTNILGIVFNHIDPPNTRYDYYPYEDHDQTMTSQKLLMKAS